jgi:hypothetical protein
VIACPWCGESTVLVAYRPMTDTFVRHCPAEDRLCVKTADSEWYDPASE